MQSQVRFNRVPEKVPEKVWEAFVRSQVKFNRILKKVPEKVPGGFGGEPGQVQQGSEQDSGEGLGCRARSGSTGFRKSLRRRSGQVQQGSGEGSSAWLGSTLQKVSKTLRLLGIPPKLIFSNLYWLNHVIQYFLYH